MKTKKQSFDYFEIAAVVIITAVLMFIAGYAFGVMLAADRVREALSR